MSVKIKFYKSKEGKKAALVYYDPITKERKQKTVKNFILKNRDPNKSDKLKQLQQIRNDEENKLLKDEYSYISNFSNVTLIEYIERSVARITSKKGHYTKMAQLLSEKVDKKLLLTKTTHLDLQVFVDSLYDQFSRNTANVRLACLRRILNDAVKEKLIPKNPFGDTIRKPSIKGKIKDVLLVEEMKKLLNTPFPSKDDRGFILACRIAFSTGMGWKDVNSLKYSQINGNVINYTRSKTQNSAKIRVSNNLIKSIGEGQGKVFNRLFDYSYAKRLLKSWISESGIEKHITFYCFRHSFAVNLLLSGMNIERVRYLMCHTKIETTVTYLKYIQNMESNEDEVLDI